ncbi:MAG: MerR family transcriptional regulator [Anaerolineae bacterium]
MVSIDPTKPVLFIGAAAELLRVHPRTLRIYEQEKLVMPTRNPGNRRLYSLDDLRKVQFVRYLTQVKGVNLAGVRIILDMLEELKKHGVDYVKVLRPEEYEELGAIPTSRRYRKRKSRKTK